MRIARAWSRSDSQRFASELRSAAALTREACAARGDRPQSSLIEAGRGGVAHDTDATLPALYIAGRDLGLGLQRGVSTATELSAGTTPELARHAALHLTMRCG